MTMKIVIMMAKEKMSKISYLYLIGDLVVVVISIFIGGLWLLNTQVAFICSMLITFAAFYGYKKSIKKRVESSSGEEFEDPYNALEDPYDLFEDENVDDKKKQKKNRGVFKYTIKGFASGIGGALNPIRILAYGILILSFLYLNKHGLFNAFAFFVGLSVVPVMSIFIALIKKKLV